MSESLLNPPTKQLDLIPIEDMPASLFLEAESKGDYTAARFYRLHPDKYKIVISLHAAGLGINRIATLVQCSSNTVRVILDNEPLVVDTEKQRLARLFRAGAVSAGLSILDDLDDPERCRKIPTRDKAVIAGVLTDKAELLSGGATARVESISRVEPDHEAFNQFLQSLPQANGLIMDPGDGAAGQKGGVQDLGDCEAATSGVEAAAVGDQVQRPVALLPAVAASHQADDVADSVSDATWTNAQ